MDTYEKGAHVYHATMPTDTLRLVRNVMQETESLGFTNLKAKQVELGKKVRDLMVANGLASVAAAGFQAPAVVVSYTLDPDIQTGKKFMALGIQTAAGVPLQCDERSDFCTFRIGLFGLEKLQNIERTLELLESAIEQVIDTRQATAAHA